MVRDQLAAWDGLARRGAASDVHFPERRQRNMSKTPRGPRTKPGVPGSSGNKPAKRGPGDNGPAPLTDDERRDLFLKHAEKLDVGKRGLTTAQTRLREIKALLKADGFSVKAVEDALLMDTPEGEAKIRDRLAATIEAARYKGSALGTQFTFDLGPDKTPSVDIAFDQGKMASMQNKPRKPPHDPSVPQYASWMAGYDEHQTTLMGGFKTLEGTPEGEADQRPRHLRGVH
jgi:hypothetical protein